MDSRIILGDFERAFENLKEVLAVPARTDLEKAGCIQYFEFCFELAWKSVQAVAGADALQIYESLCRYLPAFESLLAALKTERREGPSEDQPKGGKRPA